MYCKKIMPDFSICRNVWGKKSCPISVAAEMYGEKVHSQFPPIHKCMGKENHAQFSYIQKCMGKENHA